MARGLTEALVGDEGLKGGEFAHTDIGCVGEVTCFKWGSESYPFGSGLWMGRGGGRCKWHLVFLD